MGEDEVEEGGGREFGGEKERMKAGGDEAEGEGGEGGEGLGEEEGGGEGEDEEDGDGDEGGVFMEEGVDGGP